MGVEKAIGSSSLVEVIDRRNSSLSSLILSRKPVSTT